MVVGAAAGLVGHHGAASDSLAVVGAAVGITPGEVVPIPMPGPVVGSFDADGIGGVAFDSLREGVGQFDRDDFTLATFDDSPAYGAVLDHDGTVGAVFDDSPAGGAAFDDVEMIAVVFEWAEA